MEGQGRSRKVKEGHGWSFPITGLTFQGRKVLGGGWVACKTIVIIISLFVMLKTDADNLQLEVSLIFSDKLSNKTNRECGPYQ